MPETSRRQGPVYARSAARETRPSDDQIRERARRTETSELFVKIIELNAAVVDLAAILPELRKAAAAHPADLSLPQIIGSIERKISKISGLVAILEAAHTEAMQSAQNFGVASEWREMAGETGKTDDAARAASN